MKYNYNEDIVGNLLGLSDEINSSTDLTQILIFIENFFKDLEQSKKPIDKKEHETLSKLQVIIKNNIENNNSSIEEVKKTLDKSIIKEVILIQLDQIDSIQKEHDEFTKS